MTKKKKPTEEEVLKAAGHPAVQQEEEPEPKEEKQPVGKFYAEEELAEVEVGGQVFKVPAEAARVWQTERAARFREREPAPVQPAPPTQGQEVEDFSTRLFTDPENAIKEVVERAKKELRDEYQANESTKTFWDTFFDENPELKKSRDVCEFVAGRDVREVESMGLTGKPARDELARRIRGFILDAAKTIRPEGANPREGANSLEGGTGSLAPVKEKKPEKEQPEKPQTLGDALRERRKRRTNRAA